MKPLRKLLALLMALAMVLSFALVASAENVTITITDTGKVTTYKAYRLLDLEIVIKDAGLQTEKKLFNYTLNNKYTAVLKEVLNVTEDDDVIPAIAAKTDADAIREFTEAVYAKIAADQNTYPADVDFETNDQGHKADCPKGYYLIAETSIGAHPDTWSLRVLDTMYEDHITVATKESAPTIEKKVKDKDDVTGVITGWQDTADHDIGDTIDYQLTGTLSNKYDSYKVYEYIFTDHMTNLTYVDNSVKVYVDNNGTKTEITGGFTPNWTLGTKILTVTFNDLKSSDVTFATEGTSINKDSKIIVEYKATLDGTANIGGAVGNPNEVTLTYTNSPYATGTGSTNTTPEDKNIVYTFELQITKVDEAGAALNGATFTLYKMEGSSYKTPGTAIDGTSTNIFEFKGLDAGKYKIEETTPPAGYNKIKPIEFEIVAEHTNDPATLALTSLIVKVKNDQGTYVEETGDKKIFGTPSTSTGIIPATIENKVGTVLPSTGGMGTTLFYVIGTILVLGSGVMLVVKKRVGTMEK